MSALALIENIHVPRAQYLLETYTFENFMTIYEGKKTDAKKEYDKIIKYLNIKVKKPNEWSTYDYAKGRVNGRLFGQNSIQGLKKEIRGFLTEKLTTDIDIANCHPVILLELCLKHEFECPNLKQYITNREDELKNIMSLDNISRENAKRKILISTNSNKKVHSSSGFFKNYDKEMKKLHKQFLDKECYAYIKDYAKQDDNFEGSFINHLLCINEENILKAMRDYCQINKINIHSLFFDGLMVCGDINKSTLESMESYIQENSDFKTIKLTIKEPNHSFIMPDDFIPNQRDCYNDLKKDFELVNCKVGAEFICDIHNDFNIYSKQKFETLHEEMSYINEEGKSASFINTWFKDKFKRKYDKFDCYPKDNLCPSYVYNMWEKFPVQIMPIIENDKSKLGLKWFLEHIDVLADYNEEHSAFIKMWLAQMFQYPEHKSILLMFVGKEGSGKGTFVRFLETLMGGSHRCWVCNDPQEQIFGKFNDMMKRAFLVILDEVDKSGTYNNIGRFKNLITEPIITINPKGKTSFAMNSYHRYLGFSNNPDPSVKLKRRDFTIRMSDSKIGNTAYFNEGNNYANNLDCCKAIYDYFMTYPTKPKINENDIPNGNYNEMLKEDQKDVITEFMEDFVFLHKNTLKFSNIELYQLFIEFCKRNYIPEKNIISKNKFSTDLAFKNYNGVIKSKHKGLWINGNSVCGWTFNFDLLKTQFNEGVGETDVMDSDDEMI